MLKIKLSLFLAFLFSFFLLLPSSAYAQAEAPVTSAAPTLSPSLAIVTVISLLLGVATQIIQSGKLPKPWLPYATLGLTFLGGVGGYLNGLSTIVLNGATAFYAVAAGITALLAGAAPGIAVHAHIVVPAQAMAVRKTAARLAAGLAVAACLLFVAGCGKGEIFGPGSPITADANNDAVCFAQQLEAGNLNFVSVLSACSVTETKTIEDLWTFVVDAITDQGKISADAQLKAKMSLTAHLESLK
jgi:hypothetical protein